MNVLNLFLDTFPKDITGLVLQFFCSCKPSTSSTSSTCSRSTPHSWCSRCNDLVCQAEQCCCKCKTVIPDHIQCSSSSYQCSYCANIYCQTCSSVFPCIGCQKKWLCKDCGTACFCSNCNSRVCHSWCNGLSQPCPNCERSVCYGCAYMCPVCVYEGCHACMVDHFWVYHLLPLHERDEFSCKKKENELKILMVSHSRTNTLFLTAMIHSPFTMANQSVA